MSYLWGELTIRTTVALNASNQQCLLPDRHLEKTEDMVKFMKDILDGAAEGAELLCPSPAADLHSASAPSPGRVGCFGTRPWSCLKCNCCLQLVQKWISCGCGGRNVSVHTLRGQVPGLQCCSNGLWWLQAAAAREPKTQRVEGLGAALGCLQGFGRPEQV
ncbi:uncharacterized protein LOC135185778 isoform X8 [Pogoniulus pusillus]|uniref:uncharacterized protein LOC135185778 isoform X8 n=1 Tax=Pogoniulus pusillus TaxID=488313 RepID=UPI0030B9A9DB